MLLHEAAPVLVERGLQANLRQLRQVAKSLPQRGQAAEIAPYDTEHFAVAKAAQTGVETVLSDDFAKAGC